MDEESSTNDNAMITWRQPATVIASSVLLFYVLLTIFMLGRADNSGTTEIEWSRYSLLYGGLEALVFASAGWLFGREVNRRRAEAAEETADEATKRATANQQAAANGRALAMGVVAASTSPAGLGEESFGDRGAAPASTMDILAVQARMLFPDIQP